MAVEAADFVQVGVERVPAPFLLPVFGLHALGGGFVLRESGREQSFGPGLHNLESGRVGAGVVNRADGGLNVNLVAKAAGSDAVVVVFQPGRAVVFIQAANAVECVAPIVGESTGDGVHLLEFSRSSLSLEGAQVFMLGVEPEAGDDGAAFGLDAAVGINEAGTDDCGVGLLIRGLDKPFQPVVRLNDNIGVEAHDIHAFRRGEPGIERTGHPAARFPDDAQILEFAQRLQAAVRRAVIHHDQLPAGTVGVLKNAANAGRKRRNIIVYRNDDGDSWHGRGC